MMNVPILIHKGLGKGSSSNLGVEQIGNIEASCLCARDYKGISRMRANAVICGGVDEITEFLKVKEATNKGYAEAYEGDGVNLGVPSSKTRRGRVQNGGVNTLTTQSEMGVVVYDEQNKKATANAETINTIMADGSSPKKNARVSHGLRIRKLTETECWRLQGWSFMREDGTWDDTAIQKAKASGVSATQLYKQAGNGCSANVVEAIGRRLKEIEEVKKMTQMEEFKNQLKELQASKSFDEAYEMVEYLMYKIVDANALGRGIDRALEKYITDKELRAKIYVDAVQEKIKGDEFSEAEHEFINSLEFMNKED